MEQNKTQMGVAGGVAPQADGKHWVVLTFMVADLAQFSCKMPPEAADQLGPHLPKLLKELAEQARRADSGIILGSPEVLDLAKQQFDKRG